MGHPGWITTGSDFARTSYREEANLTLPLAEKWKTQFMAGVAESPVFHGETTLVPVLNGEVIALSLLDGRRLAGRKFTRGGVAGISLVGQNLYLTFTSESSSLHAYDLIEGRTLWKTRLKGVTGAPAVAKEHLLITALNGRVSCLNTSDGTLVWQASEPAALGTSMAVDSLFVVYHDRDGIVTCRQVVSGNLVWKWALHPDQSYSTPAICGGRVFITSLAGKVYALNLREGTPVWIWNHEDPLYTSVACDSSSLYVSSSSGKIYRLSQDDGRVQWTYDAGQFINQKVAVTRAHVVAVTARGDVIVLSSASGEEVWRTRVKGRIIIPPVVHGPYLLVADDKKWLHAFGSGPVKGEDK